ncbi:MAG: ribosome small subunit-dependent GTPase A [Anaerolineae bacterium]
MTDDLLLDGLVTKAQSGFFAVETPIGDITSQVRGRLIKERLNTDPVALGDRVRIFLTEKYENDTVVLQGMIEEVLPRARAFTRQMPAPGGRRGDLPDREQVLIANPDQVVLVFAIANPEPRLRMLDRFLVIAEKNRIPAVIVANKLDLVTMEQAEAVFAEYERIGYPVLYTSAHDDTGVSALHNRLTDQISALAGPSGVGKSSLLNAIQPELGLRVKAVSEANQKGRHTTVHPQLFPLDNGGYVADLPGIKAIGLYNIEPGEIDVYFREIEPFTAMCRFNNCRHLTEPGCAVRAAVEEGLVSPARLESYLRLREEAEAIYYRC